MSGGLLVHPLRVVGVRVELPANQPVVLLREEGSQRYLPIWIGAVEASAIAFPQQGVQPVRPLTHDLLKDVIAGLGADLEAVHITEMRENIFYAELRFAGGASVSARPSDAIALALRCDAPILGSDEVLDAAGVEIPDEPADGVGSAEQAENEVERFREFLDNISPEDFAAG
jgi:bifunctional DNase/RNase